MTEPSPSAEFYRQLFVATYDAYMGTDIDLYGGSGYGSGDPLPIETLASAERDRFGYDNPVTLASILTAQDAARCAALGKEPGDRTRTAVEVGPRNQTNEEKAEARGAAQARLEVIKWLRAYLSELGGLDAAALKRGDDILTRLIDRFTRTVCENNGTCHHFDGHMAQCPNCNCPACPRRQTVNT